MWLLDRVRDADDDADGELRPTRPRTRWDTGRRGSAILVLVAVAAAAVTYLFVWRDSPTSAAVPPLVATASPPTAAEAGETAESTSGAGPAAAPSPSESPVSVVVSVVGLVHAPGLVTLPPGSRVADAVDAAGGTREGADTVGLNLARRVEDGDQILVGTRSEPTLPPSAVVTGDGAVGAAEGGGGSAAGPVNLNSANATELDSLPGVGPVTAAAILSWRTANGRFTSIDQLAEVDGIGPARLERLRPLVTV
ncbi:helix-hairpin-helix domain-containing protein [Rhodococcus rhodnii]|nr:helix-hairpin-helix domain-containing protein [Rhodococcus rhodnii]